MYIYINMNGISHNGDLIYTGYGIYYTVEHPI